MRIVKKYANRKLYDTVDKKYVAMDLLADLIKSGEEVAVIDNQTGEDITAAVVSQLLAREKRESGPDEASTLLIQILRKGGGAIRGYAKKYAALWQMTLHMAEDEIDKIVNPLVKDKEISESEGRKLKDEIVGYSENMKKWIGRNIDKRIGEVLVKTNLATRSQVGKLADAVEEMLRKVERLERMQSKTKHEAEAGPKVEPKPERTERADRAT